MFKLPGKPSPQASKAELADFIEILAWANKSASAREAIRYLGLVDDNILDEDDGYEGCEDEQDEHESRIDAAFTELGDREVACGGAYPFIISGEAGTVLRLKENVWESSQQTAYLYLLAATRLNMLKDKKLEEIDGTLEMEHLSALALRHYLGGRCKVRVFGTAIGGSFEQRVNSLMADLRENGRFRNINGDDVPIGAKDDKLDVVGWLPFSDKRASQLIVFAQAKTGTNWRGKITEHRPDNFEKKWLSSPFLFTPIRALCVAEATDVTTWNSDCIEAGLFFDRCRLVECCIEDEDNKIPANIWTWTRAAQAKIEGYIVN